MKLFILRIFMFKLIYCFHIFFILTGLSSRYSYLYGLIIIFILHYENYVVFAVAQHMLHLLMFC